MIEWRANRLLDSSEQFEDDPKMLKILAGEVARLIALIEGAGSLKKSEIMDTLTSSDDDKARKVYRAHLDKEQDKFDEDLFVDFIRSRCREIKNI